MKETLRNRAFRYLKNKPEQWVNGGLLERLALDAGYKASTVSRRLRELAEESSLGTLDLPGYVEREERKGAHSRSVWYRWLPGNKTRAYAAKYAEAERYFDSYGS